MVILLIYVAYPALQTAFLSLQNADSTAWASASCNAGTSCWGIFENYREALTSEQGQVALRNTGSWLALLVPMAAILGLLFAVLTDRVSYETLAKSIIFLPMAISFVGAAIIWRFVYNPDPNIGLLNAGLRALGEPPRAWLANPSTNTLLLVVVGLWIWTGFTMTILSAALKNIPDEIIEAARIDGANAWMLFIYVTLPLLAPTLAVVVTTMTINTLKMFDIVWVMKALNTDVIGTRMVSELYLFQNNGLSAAYAVILIVLIIPVMVYNVRRFNFEETAK